MINLYTYNTLYLINITSFTKNDYINIKNTITNIINNSLLTANYITIYIDMFNCNSYSLLYIYKLITFTYQIKQSDIKFIKNIEFYLNITNNNKIFNYIKNICPINVNINYIKYKKKWHKIFKEYKT